MQPQSPQLQSNPIPASYLDQISSPQKKPGPNNKLVLFIIGGLVALTLIIGTMMIMSAGAPKTTDLIKLSLRLQTLEGISKKADKSIQSGALRAINVNLSTYLVNTNRDIQEPLTINKISPKSAPKSVVTNEQKNDSDLTAKLEDARLNATYDDTYRREMLYQLRTVSALMNSTYKTTKSKSLKEFLKPASKDLNDIYKQLYAFNPADPDKQFTNSSDDSNAQ